MRMTGGLEVSRLVLVLLAIGPFAPPVLTDTVQRDGRLTLTLSRRPTAEEMIAVRLTVGVLDRNARLVVRTGDGEIAGTIAPYGVRPGRKAGVFTIPLPGKAVLNNRVSLRLDVIGKDPKAVRAATPAEIEDAKLVFIPVARRVGKGGR